MPFGKAEREKIIKNIDCLAENTKEFKRVTSILSSRKIITEAEIAKMTKMEDEYSRNNRLYMVLVDKDASAYEILLNALKTTGQTELANLIDSTHVEIEKTKTFFFTREKVKKTSKEAPTTNRKTSDPDVIKTEKEGDAKNSEENPKTKPGNKEDAKKSDENLKAKSTKEEAPSVLKKMAKMNVSSVFVPGFLKKPKAEPVDGKELMKQKLAGFQTKENLKKLQASFKAYDKSGDGKLDFDEFCDMMVKEFDVDESDREALLHLLLEYDTDNDKEIDYFEFVTAFLMP